MYLNLDLLYNTYIYLFPLFYYSKCQSEFLVYCPIKTKSIYKYFESYYNFTLRYSAIEITLDKVRFQDYTFYKCKPFNLDKQHLEFLKR